MLLLFGRNIKNLYSSNILSVLSVLHYKTMRKKKQFMVLNVRIYIYI